MNKHSPFPTPSGILFLLTFGIMTSRSVPSCIYCGDTPINHPVHYLETAFSTFFSIFTRPREKPRAKLLQLTRSEIVAAILWLLAQIFITLRVVRFTKSTEGMGSRTKSIWKEAERRGIRMEVVEIFGMRRDLMRAWLPKKAGGKHGWQYFESIPVPPWLPQYGLEWVDDKYALKKIFKKNGLPVPEGRPVLTLQGAKEVLASVAGAVITKPREGSRGRHTTLGIHSEEELEKAFKRARQLCPFVLVEEYVPGRIYRATCIGKKVAGIMELVRPITVADGIKTVNELREHHNTHNKAFPQLTDVPDDTLFRSAMTHQGYALDSVPAKGTEVILAEFSERVNGGYFVDCTDEIPQETIEIINRAADVSGVDLIGFDIISKDLTNPDERLVFLEGNTLPYIEIHDIPYAGKVRNVSGAIFDLWM